MAYTNPYKIANGLILDFTLESVDADNDDLLFINSDGEITSGSGLKASRITNGGNLTELTSSVLTITGGSGAVLSNISIQVKLAGAAQSGYLSTTDWNTFNNKLSTTLSTQNIWVGDGSSDAAAVDTSSVGDILADSTNGLTIKSGVIVNADVNANAAIALTKLATVAASRALVSDGSGFIVVESSGVTATQVGYLVNLSADLQGSLNSLGETILSLAASAIAKAPDATVDGYAIVWDEANNYWDLGPVGAGGSVTGPGSSTDNALVRWNGADGTSIQNSAIIIDDSNNMTGVTSITLAQSGLHIFDQGDDHDLIFAVGEDLSVDHTLTFITGDSDRTITLSGSPTMGDWFDQSVKVAASVEFADVTVSNVGGLHIKDSDESHDLIITTSSNLTADRTLTLVPGDSDRTLTINASGTIYVTGGTDVAVADGGTGLGSISALSLLVANSANTFVELTPAAGQSIRINAGGTAWEAYTPGGGGITNGAAANELMKSDGTNATNSGLFSTTDGNIILGSASIAGGRTITVSSSDTDAGLNIIAQGASPIILNTNGGLSVHDTGNIYTVVIAQGSASSDPYIRASRGQNRKFSILSQEGENGSVVDGMDIVIKSGDAYSVSGDGLAGEIYIDTGVKRSGSAGRDGNIGLFTTSVADWQDMEKGMFIGNVTTEPTAAIANGIAIYSVDESAATILGIRTETAAVTEGATPDTTILIKYNGALYKLVAEAV